MISFQQRSRTGHFSYHLIKQKARHKASFWQKFQFHLCTCTYASIIKEHRDHDAESREQVHKCAGETRGRDIFVQVFVVIMIMTTMMMAQQWKWQWPHSLHFIIRFISFMLSGLICILAVCSNPWRAFNRKWCLQGQSVWCVQKFAYYVVYYTTCLHDQKEQLYHHHPKRKEKNCLVCDMTWQYSNLMAMFAFWLE